MEPKPRAQNESNLFGQSQALYDSLLRDTAGFLTLADALKRLAGINLPTNEKNLSLMASRVAPLLKKSSLLSYRSLKSLIDQGDKEIINKFIEALTTNTTSFFREEAHFPVLKKAILERMQDPKNVGRREIRIWCAASSTGQEPYSIAITALETLGVGSPFAIKILATDIDLDALEKASRGIYTEDELAKVPSLVKKKYFDLRETAIGHRYIAKPSLKSILTFAPLNLVETNWPFKHKFDVVMCRNVLIYFERNMVTQVVGSMTNALAPGGFLFLGHAETSATKPPSLTPISHAVWQKISTK
ncbi:MAG: protein-glutamate O-methyltransferase CheR [Chitinophagaceae bacterium]|nr:protein-glutamate O-methyltransferase CheR [Oligoflexus sp.]